MRKSHQRQFRLGATPIDQLQLNINCRDEIIPVLTALRQVYLDQALRQRLTELVAADVGDRIHRDAGRPVRRDTGRPGFDDWQVLVLAVLRTACNLDYDKLQDLAENHLSLRTILTVQGWDQDVSFDYRRIRNAVTEIQPKTIEQINQVIVGFGQELHGNAAHHARADSFVIETNIHYPTESSLMYDGMRKIISLAIELTAEAGISGWRQSKHLLRQIKKLHRQINQLSASRIINNKKDALESLYGNMIDRVGLILARCKELRQQLSNFSDLGLLLRAERLAHWIELTEQVCSTAYRRVILGERVPNNEKLFSLFETHTQLYQRGKAGEPIQYGRLALIFEDGAGFISHYHLMDRDATDSGVIVEQVAQAKQRHGGKLSSLSLDRGFHSAANIKSLSGLVDQVSCPSRNSQQYEKQVSGESKESRRLRNRHSGIESAVGALQRGNGLKRCRDRSELGLERYLGLAVLGRNLQVLGRLLIAQEVPDAPAALSQRQAAA
jgi:transposase, IS5 family